jgi:hypothetical protein
MADRLKLDSELSKILGSRNLYYQPPSNIKMKYPCFVYSLSDPTIKYADNSTYFYINHYQVIYIDSNPDNVSIIIGKMLGTFDRISVNTPYVADNLNHCPFNLYY